MATELSANNPELIESIRRNMDNSNRTQPDGNNDSTSNGNANEPTSIFNQTIHHYYFVFF
jgi:hypothetical protein